MKAHFLVCALGIALTGAVWGRGRLNLVFLMADDHRAFALGSRGDKFIHTPNLDRLAAQGDLLYAMLCEFAHLHGQPGHGHDRLI